MDRLLLILDLDETLVHGTERPLAVPASFQVGPFHIHERPGLHDFVLACARDCDLAVWTSSTGDYAAAICARVFATTPLQFLWSRDRCTRHLDPDTGEHHWLKDLRKVKRSGRDLARVLVVDDSPEKLA